MMVENAGEGIFLSDESGHYVEVNARACQMSGYTRAELLGMTAWDLAGSGELSAPDDYAEFYAYMVRERHVSATGRRLRRGDGSVLSVDVDAIYLGDGTVMSLLRDTTAQQAAREALEESEARYRRLFEDSRDAIYITSFEGAFIEVNEAMCELIGYEKSELIGMNARALYVDASARAVFQKAIEEEGAVRDHEVALRRRDGRMLACLLSSTVLRDGAAEILGYQGIIHDITERKRAEDQLLHNAFHDGLTGLPNRALFMDRLERLIRHSKRRRGYKFAVLFLDLDRFKLINDSLGHLVGDDLLILIARRLESCLREEDTVARLGGDEFAILLDAVRDVNEATRVAERVHQELTQSFSVGGHDVFTSASIGIALSSTGYDRPEDVLRDADTAMYRAKGHESASYEVFDKQMHSEVVALLQLETDLRRALDRREFELYYQPIVCIHSHELIGFEALVRWNHPEQGLLLPASFIGLAEETGLIVPLGLWIMRSVLQQHQDWSEIGVAHAPMISVNISSRQILQPDFIEKIDTLLRETGGDPRGLELEITESVFMENIEHVTEMLTQLRNRGFRLCIDDFGTGYSSLSYLQRFPIDRLKIDRSFVSGVAGDGSDHELVNTIVSLARNLSMDAVAEGVETVEQLERLRDLGARFAQGFLFSPAVKAREAEAFIRLGRILPTVAATETLAD